jgi:hypothetical protein
MGAIKRVATSLLLACGIVLVFSGLSAALGFTVPGMLASVTAIATLLYAGAVWFGAPPAVLTPAGGDTIVVFDRSLRVAAGMTPGVSLLAQFPEPLRPEIEVRCRAALRGEHTHFVCVHRGTRFAFEIAPVQSINGMVLYGVLITGSTVRVASVSAAPLTTVA